MTDRVETIAEGVTLYLGDCREILPSLGNVDAVVTDPAYGVNAARDRNSQKNGWVDYGDPGWDKERTPPEVVASAIAVGRHAIVWGGNYFTDALPPSSKWLIWDKGQSDFSLADVELAWCSFDGAARRIMYPRSLALQDGKQHPTQKPIAVMKWCIERIPPPRANNPRSLSGKRHHGRCCCQTRAEIHRHRAYRIVFRYCLQAHFGCTETARHVHRASHSRKAGGHAAMTKVDTVMGALTEWQTVPAMMESTGWQAHTLRAAISVAAKKRGIELERRRENGITSYRIKPAEYQARDDFSKSVDECYAEIKDRVAAGGPGWEPSK